MHVQHDREPTSERGLDGPVDRTPVRVRPRTGSRTRSKPATAHDVEVLVVHLAHQVDPFIGQSCA